MKVRAIGAAALGSDVQMQQALIGGAQEMMVGSTATLVGITKEMALWDTPSCSTTPRKPTPSWTARSARR
jgi:TRAP-type C4-dicarboxylate transport system substrate-binding protein